MHCNCGTNNISFKTSFRAQYTMYIHVKCIIQRSVNVNQRVNPPICNMYPYVQLCYIFTIRGDMSLIIP